MSLRTWFRIYDDVVFQRWHVRHLYGKRPDDLCDDIAGKTFIVTGPTSGIGTEVAAALCRKGAHVVLACRSVQRGQTLATSLTAAAVAEGVAQPRVEVEQLDLASLDSVRAFAKAWNARAQPLACLVNNAGIFDMGARAPGRGDHGFEDHWLTNFVAPSLLALLLLPSFRRAPASRVVNVSSIMHAVGEVNLIDPSFKERRYTPTAAYAQSKLAAIAFIAELERRLETAGMSSIRCMSVHPGNVLTGVVRTLPHIVQTLYRIFMGRVLLTPEEGARSTVFCAASKEAAACARPGPYFDSTCRLAFHHDDADTPVLGKAVWEYIIHALELDEGALLKANC